MSIKKLINHAANQLTMLAGGVSRNEMLLVLSHELADAMHESTEIREYRKASIDDMRQPYVETFLGIQLKVQADSDAPYLIAGKGTRVAINLKTFMAECISC